MGYKYVAQYKILAAGIEDRQAVLYKVAIYPNPAKDNITINVSSIVDEDVSIIFADIAGNKVKELTVKTNIPVNLNIDFPAGIYMLYGQTLNIHFCNRFCVLR